MTSTEIRDALKQGRSLTATLGLLGMTHTGAGERFRPDRQDIVNMETGEVVHTGSAAETWEWLRDLADLT